MSLRLRLGDFVAVPISAGQTLEARLIARAGRVAVLACRREDGSQQTIRVLDAPMHEQRWKMLGGHSQAAWPEHPVANRIVYDAGRAERALAAFTSGQSFDEPYVWQILSAGQRTEAHAGSHAVVDSIGRHQQLSDRQLALVAIHADRLRIDARSPHLAELLLQGHMRDVSIVGAGQEFHLEKLRFPTTLRHLTVSALVVRGVERLAELRGLRSLDLRNVELDAPLACIPDVPMLRVRGVRGLADVRDLISPSRTDIAIESQRHFRNLAPLGDHPLAGLTLIDLPQLDREAFSWVKAAWQLSSLTLDIGARRIQSELALPRPLPHATPIDLLREKSLLETSAGRFAGLAN